MHISINILPLLKGNPIYTSFYFSPGETKFVYFHQQFSKMDIIHQYSAVIERFSYFDEYLQTANVNIEEALQHLESCLQYINYLLTLEYTDHSISLYQIKLKLCQLKTKLHQQQPQLSFGPLTIASKELQESNNNICEAIANAKTKPICFGLKDIAGYTEVKKLLKISFILPIKQPQLYSKQKVSKTVLLYGPPGTGKTQLAHALAAEIKADIYCVTSSTIISPMIGETEKTIEMIFNVMKNVTKSTVLFIDEIDGICRMRHSTESDHTRRLKTELMCHLSRFNENPHAYLISATNCPWDVDTAFLRRFHNRIYIPLPTRQERIDLLKFFTQDTPLNNTSLFWEPLLDLTEGYSCSDLQDLIRKALTQPIVELEDIHVWKKIDGKYIPWYSQEFSENLIFCTIDELPEGSVMSREVTLDDLQKVSTTIHRTVSAEEVAKYTKFVGK